VIDHLSLICRDRFALNKYYAGRIKIYFKLWPILGSKPNIRSCHFKLLLTALYVMVVDYIFNLLLFIIMIR